MQFQLEGERKSRSSNGIWKYAVVVVANCLLYALIVLVTLNVRC